MTIRCSSCNRYCHIATRQILKSEGVKCEAKIFPPDGRKSLIQHEWDGLEARGDGDWNIGSAGICCGVQDENFVRAYIDDIGTLMKLNSSSITIHMKQKHASATLTKAYFIDLRWYMNMIVRAKEISTVKIDFEIEVGALSSLALISIVHVIDSIEWRKRDRTSPRSNERYIKIIIIENLEE